MGTLSRVSLITTLIALATGLAYADQAILGQQELVRDPKPGVGATKRQLVGQGLEKGSPNTIVGNPRHGGGAVITFVVNGVTSSHQAFFLPATHWSAARTTGFIYKDATGTAGPVKVAQITKSASGTFQIKVTVVGKNGSIYLVPPNPGTGGCILFTIPDGDRYHVLFGSGSVIKRNDAKRFLIKDATTEGLCPIPTTPCFTDTGDGTIHDTCTGLQWEQKDGSDSTPNASDVHDVDNRYSWAGCCDGVCRTGIDYDPGRFCQPNAEAAATCGALSDGGTQGCNTCTTGTCTVDPYGLGAITTVWDWLNQVNAGNFAGHSDWRLPSETGGNELKTILDMHAPGCGFGPSCVDAIFFPTAGGLYWSASSISPEGSNSGSAAYVFTFGNGEGGGAYKPEVHHIRAVR